ncbi:hypothetical protein H4582DRAFT_2064667 [Lactarius indigo]|nr:hypothetical protein H4582DRAFT_2064667 [Lactarius indigo]
MTVTIPLRRVLGHFYINLSRTMGSPGELSPVIYYGKLSADYYMDNENLYVSFPTGIANGNTAHVLGTWTEAANGTKKAPLTLVNYTCQFVTDKEFYVIKEGAYYRLKANVSGDKLDVLLVNERDEPSSKRSTISKI